MDKAARDACLPRFKHAGKNNNNTGARRRFKVNHKRDSPRSQQQQIASLFPRQSLNVPHLQQLCRIVSVLSAFSFPVGTRPPSFLTWTHLSSSVSERVGGTDRLPTCPAEFTSAVCVRLLPLVYGFVRRPFTASTVSLCSSAIVSWPRLTGRGSFGGHFPLKQTHTHPPLLSRKNVNSCVGWSPLKSP